MSRLTSVTDIITSHTHTHSDVCRQWQ